MKICVDAREFVGDRTTGIGRYLQNLLSNLLDHQGVELVLFVRNPSFIPVRIRDKAKCVVLPSRSTRIVDHVILPKMAEQEKADVFLSPYYKIPLFGKFKRVITVHDIMFIKGRRYGSGGWFKRMLVRWNLTSSTRKADVILADSEFTKRDLTGLIGGIEDKVKVLYPGLLPEWLAIPADDAIRSARMKYADGRRFFLYVGNCKPHKNVDLLIEAFTSLSSGGWAGDRTLILIGDDPDNRQRMLSLIRKKGAGNMVRSFANVSDDDLRLLYHSADWTVTASEYEGFGYPLLEAMACRCPVICFPRTSIPEVVGESACFIKTLDRDGVASALGKAMSMTMEWRQKLIDEGFRRAKKFIDTASQAGIRLMEFVRSADC